MKVVRAEKFVNGDKVKWTKHGKVLCGTVIAVIPADVKPTEVLSLEEIKSKKLQPIGLIAGTDARKTTSYLIEAEFTRPRTETEVSKIKVLLWPNTLQLRKAK